jgi:phage antirepressor YoqD-like protein
MYRLAGEWMPYGNHIEAGRFEVKTGVAENEHAFNAAKFTAKGISWIAGKWAIHCIQEAA